MHNLLTSLYTVDRGSKKSVVNGMLPVINNGPSTYNHVSTGSEMIQLKLTRSILFRMAFGVLKPILLWGMRACQPSGGFMLKVNKALFYNVSTY